MLVEAKRFGSVLARAVGDVQLDTTTTSLCITASTGRHTLPTWVGEFPLLPVPTTRPIVTMSGSELLRMVHAVAYAMSTDATREHLHGTLIDRDEHGVLRLVAADGHRLVVARTDSVGPRFSVTVHRAAIDVLARLDLDDNEPVEIYVGSSRVHFSSPSTTVSGRVIDLPFPSWPQVIPTALAGWITLPRRETLSALRAIVVGPRTGVRIDVDREREVVRLSTSDGDGHKAAIELPVTISGEPPERVGFAHRYLREMFEAIDDEFVQVGLGGALDPMKVETTRSDALAVLMPMRI